MSSDLAEYMLLFLGGYFITSVIATLFPEPVARFSNWVISHFQKDDRHSDVT